MTAKSDRSKKLSALVVILVLFFTSLSGMSFIKTSQAEKNPFSPDEDIGWELLDNNTVFHMWNKYNDYYFNATNGVQFSNHYNEYWTRNVLMVGYYEGDEWNLLYRTDELSGFNHDILNTSEEINVTLWKVLSYASYDFRLDIRYHLGVNDSDLTIIPYIKNLGIAIPFNIGFGWELKDIRIANVINDNYLRIYNGTAFEDILLNQTLDRSFTNMDYNTIIRLICTNPPNPYFSRSLYLSWNPNLTYKVTVKSRTNQYNAPTTLFIRVGTLEVGQEKFTKMHWLDSDDWLGIGSSEYDSHCGDTNGHTLQEALDGDDYWYHAVNEEHWFILDLGSAYTIKSVRGRSQYTMDPIDVDIYVSISKTDWGTAVATGISTWQDTNAWQEVDTTDKDGRYVKVVVKTTEDDKFNYIHWGTTPLSAPFTIFDVYGDLVSVNLLPDSDGDVQEWDRYSMLQGEHWDTVDDPVGSPDEDLSYVYTSVNDEIEEFNHVTSDLLIGATITNVRVTARMRRADISEPAAGDITIGVKVAGTFYAGVTAILSASYADYGYNWANNPADSQPWEKSDIDELQSSLMSIEVSNADVRCTQVYITVTYTPAPPDTTPPAITIKFAGNLGDSGGPYWQPPGESTPLAGAYSDGYYTNDSRQHEDWMYIVCTVSDTGSGVDTVKLCWYNQSSNSWDNTTEFKEEIENLWTVNTSKNIIVSAGHNYSFNVWANDTNNNINITWWNKTGLGGSITRRYVQLDCTPTNISYTPFYFYKTTPKTGTYTSSDYNKKDRLHHDQGPDGTLTDTGYLNSTTPTDTVHTRSCAAFLGYWFEDSVCNMPSTVNNFHYHLWWASAGVPSDIVDLFFDKSREQFNDISIDDITIYEANAISNITYDEVRYHLNANMFTTTPTSFTDNDIYELNIGVFKSLQYPKAISNRSFTSFIILNVPSNATLNTTDWSGIGGAVGDYDGEGRTCWEELYVDYTNPFLADTDNDGYSDKSEYDSGTDPNDYTDTPIPEFLWIDVTNATWALGSVVMGTSIWTNETGKTFICDMDNTTVNTDLKLQITNDGDTWNSATSGNGPNADTYRLNASIDTWSTENQIITATATTISEDITAGQNETFDLRFDAPTSTTSGTLQTITTTATIIKH